MTSPFRTKEFLALKAEWYKKLKKEGFEDVETDEEHLETWHSTFFKVRHNATLSEAKEAYYRRATHFLNDYNFDSDLEKALWGLHAEGISIRNIVKALKGKGFKAYKNSVHLKLKRLVKIMLETKSSG